MASPLLADPAVSAAKLDRELAAWRQNTDAYARRGWLLLRHDALDVEVALLGQLPFGGPPLAVVPACLHLNFDNYDIWAPSLTFIDIFTRKPAPPPVRALNWNDDGQEQNALIGRHPETQLPFLCLPGTREYHSHPEHSGDDWLLHRAEGRGSLAAICEEVWQRMVRTLVGYRFENAGFAVLGGYAHQQLTALIQGDPDRMQQQALQQDALQQALQQAQASQAQNPLPPHDAAPSAE